MKQIINTPPARTFRWLGVNGTAAELPQEAGNYTCSVPEGAEQTFVLQENSSLQKVTIEVGPHAVFRLIQIHRNTDDTERFSDIRVNCQESARFEWYRIVLGGNCYDNCSVALSGADSSFTAEIGYRLDGSDRLDVNCEAIHTGRRTRSTIHASGVMSGASAKILRSTIDLQKGCKGAVGNEQEDVLLLDETVENRSVPVILCTEEDVEGNHGTTIGQLDEDLVFYLSTRGIPQEAIYDMMARARIDAVIRRIPDPALQAALLDEKEAAI